MRLIYAMLLGFILDLIFGDPHGADSSSTDYRVVYR